VAPGAGHPGEASIAEAAVLVVAAAAATLVLSHSAEGDEELKNLLVGNILLVGRSEVLGTAALYAVIGLVHFLLREKLLMVTFHEEVAIEQNVRLRLWDFIFYVTFGVVVTSFVRIAGVYLVFSYLIVPAVCGALLSAHIRTRLLIGWAVAFVAGITGLLLSVRLAALDLPTGPTIVCAFGVLLLICAAIARLAVSEAGEAQ
jgi:zinc/manganese transport system permease protein